MSKTAESLTHPAYGQLRAVTDTASVLLADNPGLLTLDGTNTWVLRGRSVTSWSLSIQARTTTSTWHGLPRLAASRWY